MVVFHTVHPVFLLPRDFFRGRRRRDLSTHDKPDCDGLRPIVGRPVHGPKPLPRGRLAARRAPLVGFTDRHSPHFREKMPQASWRHGGIRPQHIVDFNHTVARGGVHPPARPRLDESPPVLHLRIKTHSDLSNSHDVPGHTTPPRLIELLF